MLAELSVNVRRANKLSALEACSLPIMLYVEDDIDALRQMFADAARPSPSRPTWWPGSTCAIRSTWPPSGWRKTVTCSGDESRTRGPPSPEPVSGIIAINQLSVTLKTVRVGYRGRVSKELSDQYMLTLDDLNESCWTWSDDFMPSAREEYEWLVAGDIDNSEIPLSRTASMAYNATVIRLLAGCYHEWTRDGSDWKPLAEFIRSSSLEPGSGRGALLVDAGLVAEGGITPSPAPSW